MAERTTSSCYHLPDPTFHKVSQREAMNLITAVVNIAAAPVAVLANSLIALVIFKTPGLRNPSNLFIGCLALSDVLVGLTVQPGYITYRLLENQHRSVPCAVRIMYASAFYVCCGVSFMTLSAVSYERLVAVRMQTRYNTVFSSKRVLKYMVAIWIVNVIFTALQWAGINRLSRGAQLILWTLSILVAGAAHFGIIVITRRHRRRVHPLLNVSKNVRKQREAKLTKSISLMVGVYLLLNIPVLLVAIAHQILKIDIKTYNHYSWTETLAFLNSCTNPLVCCWRGRRIRRGVNAVIKSVIPRKAAGQASLTQNREELFKTGNSRS